MPLANVEEITNLAQLKMFLGGSCHRLSDINRSFKTLCDIDSGKYLEDDASRRYGDILSSPEFKYDLAVLGYLDLVEKAHYSTTSKGKDLVKRLKK